MAKSKFNSSGSGPKPTLGRNQFGTQSRPGSGQSAAKGGGQGEGVKARPGGATKAPKGAGSSGGFARPGDAQGV